MMDETKKRILMCGALAGAFAGGLALGYNLAVHRKGQSGNMVSSKPVPEKMRVRPCEGGIFFGTAPPGKSQKAEKQCSVYCGKPADVDGNVLVLGGPGAGKTSGVVYPTLGTWPGSIVSLDCKGGMEGAWKAMHQNSNKKLFVFAPYRKHGGPCAYDPFAIMQQDREHLIEHAWDLAESLIPVMLSEREPVWKKNAENVLSGAFLYYFDAGKSFVEAIESINGLSIPEIVDLIRKSGNEKAQAFVSKLHGASGKTLASIGVEMNAIPRMTMNREIIEALTPASDRPQLDWGRFNTQRESFDVILDIPGNKLKLYAPLIRMMITQLVKTLSLRREKSYSKDDLPGVLIMLDEFPQLGAISAVVDALATLRSKGVTILLCTQSLAYLEAIYGKAVTRTILETCPYKVIFNATDTESQAYLSALIGGTDVVSGSVSFNPVYGAIPQGITFGKQRRPLIYPEALAYLRNPIIICPYGVCEVEKRSLYVKPSEPVPQNECVDDLNKKVHELEAQVEALNQNRGKETSSQMDSPPEEADDTDASEESAVEAVMDSICAYCEKERSAKEIMRHINVAGSTNFREVFLNPLLKQGRLRMTHPDTPQHPKQTYQWVKCETDSSEPPNNTSAHLNIRQARRRRETR